MSYFLRSSLIHQCTTAQWESGEGGAFSLPCSFRSLALAALMGEG